MRILLLAGLVPLAACTTARPATVGTTPRPQLATVGLERVMGQDQAALIRLFGAPDAEMREGTARKLQFQSGICVLDAYLYPKGGELPRVTWLDARQPDGKPIDRASCVGAISRRSAAR